MSAVLEDSQSRKILRLQEMDIMKQIVHKLQFSNLCSTEYYKKVRQNCLI